MVMCGWSNEWAHNCQREVGINLVMQQAAHVWPALAVKLGKVFVLKRLRWASRDYIA